jgi:dephospho-CoA kinase
MKNILKIGITGGIGSGKSYISKIFSSFGVPIYNADLRSRELSNLEPIKSKIIETFGEQFYIDGELDRKGIAKLVFNNSILLNKLNSIIHPVIEYDFLKWCIGKDSKYVLKESAIFFETGLYKNLDYIILVTAPENVKIKRVIQRDNLSKDDIKKRMNSQWKDDDKIKLSDFIIDNDGEKNVNDQVIKIHNKLINI